MAPPSRVGLVLFEGFELLDVVGPVELFAHAPELFAVELVGPSIGPVASAQGHEVVAEVAFAEAMVCDVAMVPGGMGTRRLVTDPAFLEWLGIWASRARYVTSVCTGSGLLAAAGLLDGYRATSNKRAFSWASCQGETVEWVPHARWVVDRNRWTSSGVTAGMDMTLALISSMHGEAVALEIADQVEYEWHREPCWDPFAAKHGLART
ncbi:MAG: DJ-1/PfpI family protein [Acidimicrobiales bacterium]